MPRIKPDEDHNDPRAYAAGVGIALLSTLCSAIGLLLQKLTHRRLSVLSDEVTRQKQSFSKQPLFWLGIVFMGIGAALSFAVFAFLGQSRASAMAAITILWNGIMSALFLNERFTAWDGLVSSVIICGAVIAVVYGSSGASTQPVDSLSAVVDMLSRQIVWVAAIVVIVIYGLALVAVRRISRVGRLRTTGQIRLECYLCILISAIHTGITGMLSSSVVNSISGAVQSDTGSDTAGAWQFWLLVVCLPASLVLQVSFLNSALSQMDALEIVPPYQAGVICIGLVWGIVFLGDADTMEPSALALFCVGCGIACCGVVLLAFKRRMTPRLDAIWERWGWTVCLLRVHRESTKAGAPAGAPALPGTDSPASHAAPSAAPPGSQAASTGMPYVSSAGKSRSTSRVSTSTGSAVEEKAGLPPHPADDPAVRPCNQCTRAPSPADLQRAPALRCASASSSFGSVPLVSPSIALSVEPFAAAAAASELSNDASVPPAPLSLPRAVVPEACVADAAESSAGEHSSARGDVGAAVPSAAVADDFADVVARSSAMMRHDDTLVANCTDCDPVRPLFAEAASQIMAERRAVTAATGVPSPSMESVTPFNAPIDEGVSRASTGNWATGITSARGGQSIIVTTDVACAPSSIPPHRPLAVFAPPFTAGSTVAAPTPSPPGLHLSLQPFSSSTQVPGVFGLKTLPAALASATATAPATADRRSLSPWQAVGGAVSTVTAAASVPAVEPVVSAMAMSSCTTGTDCSSGRLDLISLTVAPTEPPWSVPASETASS